jgi:hypothetical protein
MRSPKTPHKILLKSDLKILKNLKKKYHGTYLSFFLVGARGLTYKAETARKPAERANPPPYSRASPPLFFRRNKAQISPPQDARNNEMVLFPDFLVRCVLDCGCPLSSADGGAFRLGVALPRAAQRRRGGRMGGGRPRPSDFCAVAGRERASGPTRRAKWAKKWFTLGS